MHIDPELTDAFNALISGSKWWASLPADLYEFRDDLTCDPQCSEPFDNFHRQTGVWFIHIMPQIRYVLYNIRQGLGGHIYYHEPKSYLKYSEHNVCFSFTLGTL